jgi:dUTP pyrophosphatase
MPSSPSVRVLKLRADIQLPRYQTAGAAGLDLMSAEDVELRPMQRHAVSTGLALEIPEGFEGQVRPRSGLALKAGLTCLNSPGTIDSDYRGEVKVLLVNLSSELAKIRRGERIAQLVIAPVCRATLVEVEGLEETGRGRGGFGSTGVL